MYLVIEAPFNNLSKELLRKDSRLKDLEEKQQKNLQSSGSDLNANMSKEEMKLKSL